VAPYFFAFPFSQSFVLIRLEGPCHPLRKKALLYDLFKIRQNLLAPLQVIKEGKVFLLCWAFFFFSIATLLYSPAIFMMKFFHMLNINSHSVQILHLVLY
jgi:hypothetical protein